MVENIPEPQLCVPGSKNDPPQEQILLTVMDLIGFPSPRKKDAEILTS